MNHPGNSSYRSPNSVTLPTLARGSQKSKSQMRHLLVPLVLLVAACGPAPGQQPAQTSAAAVQTINNVPAQPATLNPPPQLQDEAPPPKPKALPWEKPTPIVFSPEDEKIRSSLPFTPAIAMDPIDGSKISIRANTPTFEFEGRIYYFSSEAHRTQFKADPKSFLKGRFTQL